MAKRILKFPLNFIEAAQFFAVPHGSQFVSTGLDGQDQPSVWITVDPAAPVSPDSADHLRAVVVPTGGDLDVVPDTDFAGHLCTFADVNGFVWHVFVLPSENETARLKDAALQREAMMAAMRSQFEAQAQPAGEANTNEA